MAKYECNCGYGFRTKKQAQNHVSSRPVDPFYEHRIRKVDWPIRLALSLPDFSYWYIYTLAAAAMLNVIILRHTDYTFIEKFLESICAGLIAGRILQK